MRFLDDPALDNPFWRFSLDRYARPGVSPACLALQDRAGIDVNLLLFAFWLGSEGRRMTRDSAALTAITDWHDTVVIPLRRTRIALRPGVGQTEDPIRSAVKQVELQAEQIEQALLYRHADTLACDGGRDSQADMIHNAQVLLPPVTGEQDTLARLVTLCL